MITQMQLQEASVRCTLSALDWRQYIRPFSDTVPLWSGSSYRTFVYIDNDVFLSCSWL